MRVFVLGGRADVGVANEEVWDAAFRLGQALQSSGHQLVACSPFAGSAEREVVRGVANARTVDQIGIEFHYPQLDDADGVLDAMCDEYDVHVTPKPHLVPGLALATSGESSVWQVCQLAALDASDVVIALGGQNAGVATITLLVAEARMKAVLPAEFTGGASAASYSRLRDVLGDRLGRDARQLRDASCVESYLELARRLVDGEQQRRHRRPGSLRFFISYSHKRPADADLVERILRRQPQRTVIRDEADAVGGADINNSARRFVEQADVFVVLWSNDYAISPHCHDEMELALDRLEGPTPFTMLIFELDDTRMTHRRARPLRRVDGRSYALLEQNLRAELEKIERS